MAFSAKCSRLWRSTLARYCRESRLSPSSSYAVASSPSGVRFMSGEGSSKLFVGGLSWGTDENSLRDAFSSFGEILDAKVVMDRETGRSKGFGFVSFASTQDADSAMKTMDGRDLNGRQLRVNFAIEKPLGDRFGGGGGFGYGGGAGDEGGGGGGGSSFDFGSGGGGGGGTVGDTAGDTFDFGDSGGASGDGNKTDFGSSSFGKAPNDDEDLFSSNSSFNKDSY